MAPVAVAGGALGTAAGRAGRQLISDVFGVKRAEGVDAVTDILMSGIIGAGAEVGGVVAARAAGRLLRPFARKIPDESKQAISFFEDIFGSPLDVTQGLDPKKFASAREFIAASRANTRKLEALQAGFTELGLTPAQVTENGFLDFVEAFTEGSFLGGGRLKNFKALTLDAMGAC